MSVQIQLRRGLAAEWANTNPILAQGEIGVTTDTKIFKIGDGVLAWNALQNASVSDHGALAGLLDDDHTQYALADGTRGAFAATSHTHTLADITDEGTLAAQNASAVAITGGSVAATGNTAVGGPLSAVQSGAGVAIKATALAVPVVTGATNDAGNCGTINLLNVGGTPADGALATGISFGRVNSGRRGALVAASQDTADGDQIGLKFFTRNSTVTGNDDLNLLPALHLKNDNSVAFNGAISTSGNINTSANFVLDNDNALFWGSGDGSTNIKGNSSTDALTFTTVGVERMRIDSGGNISVNTTPSALRKFNIGGDFNAVTFPVSAYIAGNATVGNTSPTLCQTQLTANADANLTAAIHYLANQGTLTTGAVVGQQYGYVSNANMIGAANNYGFAAYNTAAVTAGKVAYGFHSAINTATGGGTTWNFYSAGTAPNYFAGDVQIGNASAITGLYGGSNKLHVTGASGVSQSLFANTATGQRYDFIKSRNTTVGLHTIVQNNDNLGGIYWGGSDGVAFIPSAYITAIVDGIPGVNDMPGRLVFSTTADGAATPSERMKIDSLGDVKIGDYVAGGLTATTGVDFLVSGVDNPLVSIVDNANGSTLIGANSTHGYIGVDGARPLSFKTGCTYNVADSGTTRMIVDSTAVTLNNGALKLGSSTQSTITANTTDAADTSSILMCGGGGASSTRGSYIWVFGNEHATNPGKIILASGGGDIEVNGGALNLISGHVRFPATQVPSADANTLDDYEEGTFTPTITFGGNSVGVTYTAQNGIYTKIGREISFNIRLVLSNKGSSTGAAVIVGLPFVEGNLFPRAASIYVNAMTSGVGDTFVQAVISQNTSTILLRDMAGGAAQEITDVDLTNTSNFFISGTYTI